MTITLPSALDRLVKDKLSSGLFSNETEVICDALRRDLAQDSVSQWIQKQAEAGFAQLDEGDYADLSRDEILTRLSLRRSVNP
jgi:Arc/MetJ-type ribon-helix-helix transcriptional regulator